MEMEHRSVETVLALIANILSSRRNLYCLQGNEEYFDIMCSSKYYLERRTGKIKKWQSGIPIEKLDETNISKRLAHNDEQIAYLGQPVAYQNVRQESTIQSRTQTLRRSEQTNIPLMKKLNT